MKFIAQNCTDPDLLFEVSVNEEFDLVAYGSTGLTSFAWSINTLCLNLVEVNLSTEYPEGTWGLYDNITCELTGEFWAGAPVFKFQITEIHHNVPGLVLEYYILLNIVSSEWEAWENFDPITGPSCSTCCDSVDRPFLILNNTIPVTDNPLGISWVSTLPDPLICSELNSLRGIRNSFICEVEKTQEFTDCWKFIPFQEGIPVLNLSASILLNNEDITFYEDCEDCLEIKNEPPCIKLTNCLTGEETIISFSESLNSYVGKVIKLSVPLNGTFVEYCYTVSLSETCPEEPTLLPGTFIDCFQTCEKCLPKCLCTKALNSSTLTKRLSYLDCEGILQQTSEEVLPGNYSLKYCVSQWADPDVQNILEFGECIDGNCPEIIQPKKFIAPGYDTPLCTPNHYEKIVCQFAKLKYNEVMSKRYGLNLNCDDTELLTATIKFQLLQMQILEDPEFNCDQNSSCNNCDC
jgi:hypothetical protein